MATGGEMEGFRTDTEPEIEPDITDPSEDETPVHRITFVRGPRTLSTAHKSTRPPGKKPKLDPETTTSEPWGLRVARASDHPHPAPGSCGWLED
uniref:OSJNBa0022F16.17 protein n=1 Tax=Oryza sativa subsp. japonica TaxID=39947 RepID=Q7XKY7_ORYSJ|nr:OSJNBa0022F16.17 [Oryza sativa Japonica Group]